MWSICSAGIPLPVSLFEINSCPSATCCDLIVSSPPPFTSFIASMPLNELHKDLLQLHSVSDDVGEGRQRGQCACVWNIGLPHRGAIYSCISGHADRLGTK